MNNQKDIQKTEINSYGHNNVSDSNTLLNNGLSRTDIHVYDFATKKTEKLATALYMVTDCMDAEDALKVKLRLISVELLSDIYKLSTLAPMDKSLHISVTLNRINELLSFINIACSIGFISEMNGSILNREFNNLVTELKSYQPKDTHFTFTLDEKMFEVPRLVKPDNNYIIKDNYKGQEIKDRNNKNNSVFFQTKMDKQSLGMKIAYKNLSLIKEDRTNKILSLIKDNEDLSKNKFSLTGGQQGVSIKDISVTLTDCSEKTIQRELNSLVSRGLIKKTGAKRWSRYQILKK